jgi:hypothetical protein
MDPVALIVVALAAGTGLGPRGSAAAQDASVNLWKLVRRRLSASQNGAMLLARHAEAPRTWASPLAAELVAAGAARDEDLVAAASTLLRLADRARALASLETADAE